MCFNRGVHAGAHQVRYVPAPFFHQGLEFPQDFNRDAYRDYLVVSLVVLVHGGVCITGVARCQTKKQHFFIPQRSAFVVHS
jgi:hypothetical protein